MANATKVFETLFCAPVRRRTFPAAQVSSVLRLDEDG